MENNKPNDCNETEIDDLITGKCVKEDVNLSMDSSLTYRTNSVQSLSDGSNLSLEVVWHNVRYVVQKKSLHKSKVQTVELIRNASGRGVGGKVTALLGPSGCGKTTLLECIAGLRSVGLTGHIYVTSGPKTRIAFCPQKDHHLEQLSVKETLLFATKLKNYNKNDNKTEKWDSKAHHRVVDNVLKQLGLDSCAKVRVSACSGGQRKRLSIGIELVNRPNILFLDEPTSGLDSSSCLQCIKLLQHLSRGSDTMEPMVIIASIHQPSAQVLNRIDYLYIMSNGGRPIYFGPTNQLTNTISSYGLSCPMYETPTEFVVGIASGDQGINIIERMAFNQMERSGYFHDVPDESTSVAKIVQKSKRRSHPFFLHIWQLLLRTNLCIWRQPQLTALRLFTSIAIAIMISFIYVNPIGRSSGCMETILLEFDIMRPMGDCLSNLGFVFFSLLFIALSAKMPTILTFPLEMNVFLRERANGWYSCGAYYIAKSIADIPYQVSTQYINQK